MKLILCFSILLAAFTPGPGTVFAAQISGLFNTGVSTNGTLLGDGAVDPHYKLVQSDDASAPGPNAVVVNGSSSPLLNGPWMPNGPNSKWIAPSADQNVGNAPGRYTYRISFDLTGLDPATAVITGRWNTDNDGVEVLLNGHSLGISKGTDFANFSPTFTITNFFVPGVNNLDFGVLNYAQGINPTAFRAEVAGTAAVDVPSNTPPTILVQPVAVNVGYRDPASFTVSARGSPPLQYEWRLNGVPIPGGTNNVLSISNVTGAHVGAYYVVVRNAFGSDTSSVVNLTMTFPSSQQASYEPLGPSSRRTGLVFSEVMYHPTNRADGKVLEFIELYNSNPFFEDIGGWRITGDVDYVFPAGTKIAANSFIVVAPSPGDVQSVYGITGVLGGFTNRLPNSSGTIRLRKKSGGIVLQLNYSDGSPWPVAADGAGHSLVLARPSFGEGSARAWAASAVKGGSPGASDPVPSELVNNVVINEILAHTDPPLSDYVELFNNSPVPIDISGCWLSDDPETNKFRIPNNTIMAPGGFAVFHEQLLGFALSADGEGVYFVNSNQTRVLDAVRFEGQANGVALGRFPNGADAFYPLSARTPGTNNARFLNGDVVISEIMFNPVFNNNDDQFVELFNRGTNAISLAGWRFTSGIDFTFPTNAAIPAGGYIVVAKNAARMLTNYAGLGGGKLFGNFSDKLSHRGERLALGRPDFSITTNLTGALVTNRFFVTVDEVTYGSGGRWGRWSDGGGSSLELIDARSDHRLAPNWADSDETGKATWTVVENTGVLDLGWGNADRLQLFLLGAGDALVDDVEVLVSGVNRVGNGNFESGTSGWTFQGTHSKSSWENVGYNSAHSLHLRASARGDQSANRIFTPLTSAIPTGTVATIRAKVRWLSGHPEILFRLKGNYLEATARLSVPSNLGTPGAPNSRAAANAGPAISEVMHYPVLPKANQPIQVTARVDDPDGLQSITLKYRVDPSATISSVTMTDDGAGSDLIAGDGIFTGTIPGQTSGALIAFRVEAADLFSPSATAKFLSDAPARECLVRVGETQPTGAFATYRLWMTAATQSTWATRAQMSNEDLDTTFVYGSNRVIYNAGAHYSGSSSTAQGYDSPVGVLCGYSISLPEDGPFLGGKQIVLDWPVRDLTDQREQLMFWFLDQLGLPNMYRRYIHLHVNGVNENSRPVYPAQIGHGIFDDVQQPGSDVIDEWFSDDNDGPLHKSNCWEEFNDAGTMEPVNCIRLNSLQNFTTTGGVRKVASYRWNWQPRAVQGSANDFSALFTLVDAVNAPASNFLSAVESVVDVDHWMRTFVANDLAANWDSWGNFNAKNSYIYKPAEDGWKILSFDFDVGIGVLGADTPTATLFDPNDPALTRMNTTPTFIRRYWCALSEAVNGFFRTGAGTAIDGILDAKYASFQANGIPLGAPDSIKSWIGQRRSFLQSQLNTVAATFAVNGPASFSTNQNPLTLSGTAPVTVHSITVNGIAYTPVWTSVTNWLLTVPLGSPTNTLNIVALDRGGVVLYQATRTVTYTGPLPPPVSLFINEWMADNGSFLIDPATQRYEDWFEIYNPTTNRVDLGNFTLTDEFAQPAKSRVPSGFSVPPLGFLLVWADGTNGSTATDTNLHVAFNLSKGGEAIGLYDSFGRQIDGVTFAQQSNNISQGRWRDGSTNQFFMPVATPGAPNVIPNPAPRISAIINAPSEITLTWSGQPGRTYRIQSKKTLSDTDWANLPGEITAVAATCSKTLNISATQCFYRVVGLD